MFEETNKVNTVTNLILSTLMESELISLTMVRCAQYEKMLRYLQITYTFQFGMLLTFVFQILALLLTLNLKFLGGILVSISFFLDFKALPNSLLG